MIIEKEMENTKVLISKEEKSVLVFDRNSGNLFYERDCFDESNCSGNGGDFVESILAKINLIPPRNSVFVKTDDNVFKINLSTLCNLNCDYCFRDKKSHIRTELAKAKRIINFIIDDYAPHIWFYSFSVNLTSESLIELNKIKEIKQYIDERTRPGFSIKDFKSLESALRYLSCFPKVLLEDFSDFDNLDAVVKKMDSLLNLRNLVSFFPVPDGMILPEWEANQLKNLQNLDFYSLREFNLRFLEAVFPETILRKPHYAFSICTNGTVFSKEVVDFLKEIRLDSICVSLDGPSCVHNLHRPFHDNKASHGLVVENIRKFMDAGFKVCVAAVITSDYPYPLNLTEYFKELGVSAVSLSPVRAGTEASFDEVSVERLLSGYERLFERFFEDVVAGDYSLVDLLKDDSVFLGVKMMLGKGRLVKRCKWNENTIFDDEGDIYPCDYFIGKSKFIRGNIRSKDVKDVCEGNLRVDERINCKDCWCKYLCGGTCYYNSFVNSEDISVPDPVECKLKKGLMLLSLRFMQKLLDSGIDLLDFGKKLGLEFDDGICFDRKFFVEHGVIFSVRGSLTKVELEIRKVFEALRKSSVEFEEEIFISVLNVSETNSNKILEIVIIVATDNAVGEDLCGKMDCKSLDSFDFGKVISCESLSDDKSVEGARNLLLSAVEKYKIPVSGNVWYKGSLDSFLGYQIKKMQVFVQRMKNVF